MSPKAKAEPKAEKAKQYVAAEHIYEHDANGEPYRLAIPKGDPVSAADMKRLGVSKDQVEEAPSDEG
jgi:hypothetical protein